MGGDSNPKTIDDHFLNKSPPISMIRLSNTNFDKQLAWVSNISGELGSDHNKCPRTLATLPSFLGKNEDTLEIVQLLIIARKWWPQQVMGIEMHKILKSSMNITLTLEEILRCKLELWT